MIYLLLGNQLHPAPGLGHLQEAALSRLLEAWQALQGGGREPLSILFAADSGDRLYQARPGWPERRLKLESPECRQRWAATRVLLEALPLALASWPQQAPASHEAALRRVRTLYCIPAARVPPSAEHRTGQ